MNTGTSQVKPRIARAASDGDRNSIYRFRYEIYVREMHRLQKAADHEHMSVSDPLDERGINIAAWSHESVVGAVRVNIGRAGDFYEYDDFYKLDRHASETIAIVTKLMVSARYRKSDLALRLAEECFLAGMRADVDTCFLDCNDHLTHFFERLGCVLDFRDHHPDYGDVSIFKFDMKDTSHLRNINSPFFKFAADRGN